MKYCKNICTFVYSKNISIYISISDKNFIYVGDMKYLIDEKIKQ